MRSELWKSLIPKLEQYRQNLANQPVHRNPSLSEVSAFLDSIPLGPSHEPGQVLNQITGALESFQLHSAHPMYFGVFNPHPSFMGILGELVTAAFNPQLASTASGLIAIETEKRVLSYLASKAGWDSTRSEGSFCTGGTEANLTALLVALAQKFPTYKVSGLQGLSVKARVYVSTETHHSIQKAARTCGLGTEAVREIPVGADLRMDLQKLEAQIAKDVAAGDVPLMAVATLGSTSAGVIDEAAKIQKICERYKMWFHVDAAWGAAALLLPEYKMQFAGLEWADSLTIDAHKWFSVPMGAGIFLTRHAGALEQSFRLDESPYMPPDSVSSRLTQPYAESLHWSRRFIGLKFFLTLAAAGEEGYQQVFRHQIEMAELLRRELKSAGWNIVNETPWPVVCFTRTELKTREATLAFVDRIQKSGETWVTPTELTHTGETVVRAGISSFSTEAEHIQRLVACLTKNVSVEKD